MAVCADEFALSDLGEHGLATKPPQLTHLSDLLVARKVIPGHRRMMEKAATVDARLARLEFVVPVHQFTPSLALPRHQAGAGRAEVRGVVRLPTRLAPRLTAVSTPVEVVERLSLATASAYFHL
jgi:hypothetical protein